MNLFTNSVLHIEEIVKEVKDKAEHEIHMKDVVRRRRVPYTTKNTIGNARMTVVNKFIT